MRRVYFARPENVAATKLDALYIAKLRVHPGFNGATIVAPQLAKESVDFLEPHTTSELVALMVSCSVLVYLPFPDGALHSRHAQKISMMIYRGSGMVYEFTSSFALRLLPPRTTPERRVLSPHETRKRIWAPGERYMNPFT